MFGGKKSAPVLVLRLADEDLNELRATAYRFVQQGMYWSESELASDLAYLRGVAAGLPISGQMLHILDRIEMMSHFAYLMSQGVSEEWQDVQD